MPLSEAHRAAISTELLGNQHARKYESTPANKRAYEAAYRRALRAAQKERQKAHSAQGQISIDQAFKKQ